MKTILTLLALTSLAFADRTVVLSWEANPATDNLTGYEVYLDGKLRATVAGNVTGADIVIPDGKCELTVCAVNIAGRSAPSEPLAIPATPSAPKGVRIKVNVQITVTE